MMMDPASSLSDDSALADALSKLEILEKENVKLRQEMNGGSHGTGREHFRLKQQNEELMKVNHQWDLEFRDLNEDFQRYRIDSQRAQSDSKSTIAHLKEEKEKFMEKYRAIEDELNRLNLENQQLKARVTALEQDLRAGGSLAKSVGGGGSVGEGSSVPYAMVSFKKVKELEEECQVLRQQLKTYQDDFAEERKDRQRMNEEKQCAAIKHDAEVTSLKLQLERTKAELAHYTSEANRLSQQLRMKNQQEEEQYKKHLESKGYLTRSPSGRLPPMDPFVELDEEKEKLPKRSASSPSPRLLTRGVDIVQAAYSSSQAMHASSSSSRSRSPVNMLADTNTARSAAVSNTNGVLPIPPQGSPPYSNGGSYIISRSNGTTSGRTVSPTPLTNGTGSSRPAEEFQYAHYGGGLSNGDSSTSTYRNKIGLSNGISNGVGVVNGTYSARPFSAIPPIEAVGRYSCPRCERKFKVKPEYTDHIERCLA